MVGLEDFLIQFEKPEKIYSPGDDISGQLVIDLREREKFDRIKVDKYYSWKQGQDVLELRKIVFSMFECFNITFWFTMQCNVLKWRFIMSLWRHWVAYCLTHSLNDHGVLFLELLSQLKKTSRNAKLNSGLIVNSLNEAESGWCYHHYH